ncbi:MAG: TIGR01459 family HAD-type hydrolase [Hyphomonadaceae bacterium]|nr:TIGR01459 family HAD-type hydrolase [Hyphomonadaceae bacterium]
MIVLDSVEAVAERYDAVLCDVWGVIHNGRRVYPEAAAALTALKRRGLHVVLLTNVPKPRAPIPGQLDRLGFPRAAYDVIVTSGDATRAELAKRAPGPMYKIGPARDAVLWEGLGLAQSDLAQARFVGVSGLNRDDETPELYAETLRAARARDLELISANPDIVVRVGDELIWCAGALARDYEKLGGRVVMAGKPFAPIYDLAYRELAALHGREIDRARVLAIGDGIGTDIAGANGQGLDCVFIASGMHGEAFATEGALDTAKVDAALAAENARASYVMHALR